MKMKPLIYLTLGILIFLDLITIIALKFLKYNTLVSQKYEGADYSSDLQDIEFANDVSYILLLVFGLTSVLLLFLRKNKGK